MASVAIHPEYHRRSAYFDVALMTLERAVDYGDYVLPVCLPEAATSSPDAHRGKLVTLTGWGLRRRNALRGETYLQRTHLGIFSQK